MERDATEVIGLDMVPRDGGVKFTTDICDPLNFIWQDERQVRAIIRKLREMVGDA